MPKKRPVFVIPGFRQTPKNKAYREISKLLVSEGFQPFLMDMSWKKRTVSKNTEYFLKEYKKIRNSKKNILGFSYGAMIAFLASTKVEVDTLILCSLSPYFQEDVMHKRIPRSPIQADRHSDFSKLNSTELAKKIKARQILMLYGSKEAKSLVRRVVETFDDIKLSKKQLLRIKKTEHNIGDKRYLQTIHEVARTLN